MTSTPEIYDLTTLFGFITILSGIVGFFLRVLHKDLKDVIEQTGKLKGKTSTMEKDMEANRNISEMQLSVISESLRDIKEDFKKVLDKVQTTDEIIIKIHSQLFKDK